MQVTRRNAKASIAAALTRSGVAVLTGPRQCGKTTLAREFLSPDDLNYFDLESPVSLARLSEPMTTLDPLTGLVVIDEVQRMPGIFPILRVLADRRPRQARFLILGSASGDLLRQAAESLAGRVEYVTLGGFTLEELGPASAANLWLRGGFPDAFLAGGDHDSRAWRRQFIQTLLERDLPQWGIRVPATTLRRFWMMLAHYHGQVWKASEPARAMGVSEPTVGRYLDILTDAMMIRQLQPWHANLKKRQVKFPKIYIRDTGLLHELLGIDGLAGLLGHPKIGASWEGFAIEQVLASERHDAAYFWATHQGAEIDLLLSRGDRLFGVECKRADAPRLTPSIRIALQDLSLDRVAVVYPGATRYPLGDRVEAVPLETLAQPGALFGDGGA